MFLFKQKTAYEMRISDCSSDVCSSDLFPRHFIIGLDAPTNYFCPRKVFIDGMPDDAPPRYLRYITDNEDVLPLKHRINHPVDELPDSMIAALRDRQSTRLNSSH